MENKMMVMRRALRDVSRVAEEMTRGTITGESVDRKTVDAWAMRLCEIVSRDLAIPLRQCDVGTAEEQTTRYRKFCAAHKYLGSDSSYVCKGFGKGRCPFFNSHTKSKCEFAWAQTPYEAQEGAGK